MAVAGHYLPASAVSSVCEGFSRCIVCALRHLADDISVVISFFFSDALAGTSLIDAASVAENGSYAITSAVAFA